MEERGGHMERKIRVEEEREDIIIGISNNLPLRNKKYFLMVITINGKTNNQVIV